MGTIYIVNILHKNLIYSKYTLINVTIIFRLFIGMEVLWPLKDLSMDNVITTQFEQCCATTYGCNNLRKKRVLCHEKNLCKVFLENVDEVEDSKDVRNGFHDREINLAMCYMLDDCVKSSIEGL